MCIPDFVRKGVHCWFAVDNIDFLEFTAYGQHTLHGCLIVMFQKNEDGETINPPLKLPIKLPKKQLKIALQYKREPEIKLQPIKFDQFSHDFAPKAEVEKYFRFTQTWILSSIAGNEKFNRVPEQLQKVVPSDTVGTPEDETDSSQEDAEIEEADIPDQILPEQMIDSADEDSDGGEDGNLPDEDTEADTVDAETALKIVKTTKKTGKLKKKSVMPTWAATQHLLAKQKGGTPDKEDVTNCEPVAPLFRDSPKDWATLWTVLSHTQDINALVLGEDAKVFITLDMDLYKLAVQLKQSVKNKHWVLMPGHLHMFFADEHSLGKVIEGSGLDTVAIESGIYSAARIRSMCDGKKYTEGMEFHIMFALSIYSLKLEAVLGRDFPQDLQTQARSFRDALHEDSPDMIEIYEDLANHYSENIKSQMPNCQEGLPKFLNNYLEQVETFLACVSAIHNQDLEACLTLIDRKIKYYSGMDQPWYFKLMTVHLGEMNELKWSDPATWERLKQSFVVTKSTLAFCNLFTDQGLEQEIKKLKRYGNLPGITQDEEAVDRFLMISPQLAKYVESFLGDFPKTSDSDQSPVYHQLQGNMGLRCAMNSVRIRDIIVSYCQGNPFIMNTPLKNITSGVIIPKTPADDILNYPAKGQARYKDFIETRLKPGSTLSIWDPLPQLNLKRFATWMKTKSVRVGNKVIKLKEDRKLLSKIIIIAQTRPDLITKMEDIVGNFEMSVIPRANFSPDGSMLLTADKSSLMKLIIAQKPLQVQVAAPGDKPQVLIIDAMPEVKCLKKKATTSRLFHIRDMFIQRIQRKTENRNYTEVFIAFDEWRDESLKDKTRAKRAHDPLFPPENDKGYDMHDGMSLKQTSMADLQSTNKRKTQLAEYLAKGILDAYKGNGDVRLVATYSGKICLNEPHILPQDFTSHNHEEADQQIPLLLLHSLSESTNKHFDVYSPDTDVLVELLDLVSRGFTDDRTNIMHAGKENAPKPIDIMKRVHCIGREKSLAMVGLHTLSGEDHGNKFVGITKNAWCKIFFDTLDFDHPIVEAFGNLGSLTPEQCALDENGEFTAVVKPLEKFICIGYDPDGPYTIPELRWKLWSSKNKEAENLPPCRNTLAPIIQRTNHVGRVYKSYTQTHPDLPELTLTGGWTRDAKTNALLPVYCLVPPAPKAVLELVKCGCNSGCNRTACSCYKNHLPCSTLCQCSEACTNTL